MSEKPFYKQVTTYELTTGRLVSFGRIGIDTPPEDDHGHLPGYSDLATQYYNQTEDIIESRIPLDASLSATSVTLGESVTLAPLPIPCTVSVAGVDIVVEDGALEITPQSIGEAYRILVDELQFLRTTYFFDVVDP
jgi:hypothetical protein